MEVELHSDSAEEDVITNTKSDDNNQMDHIQHCIVILTILCIDFLIVMIQSLILLKVSSQRIFLRITLLISVIRLASYLFQLLFSLFL